MFSSVVLVLFLFIIENMPEKYLPKYIISKYLKDSTQHYILQETKNTEDWTNWLISNGSNLISENNFKKKRLTLNSMLRTELCLPPYVEALTLRTSESDCIWRRVHWVKMRSLGWALIQCDWFLIRRNQNTDTKGRVCEEPGRKRPSTSQGERPREKPHLPIPWPWTPSFQDCEKVPFCS